MTGDVYFGGRRTTAAERRVNCAYVLQVWHATAEGGACIRAVRSGHSRTRGPVTPLPHTYTHPFATQSDGLLPSLSVRQTFWYAAALRIGRQLSQAELHERVRLRRP